MATRFQVCECDGCISLPVDGSRGASEPTRNERPLSKLRMRTEVQLEMTIEGRLGRKLSSRECVRGCVQHPDDRGPIDRMYQEEKWQSILHPKKPESIENPFTRRLKQHEEEKAKKQDIRLRGSCANRPRRGRPKRQSANGKRKWCKTRHTKTVSRMAQQQLTMLQFDKRATAAEVYDAQMRLQMVQECDVPAHLRTIALGRMRPTRLFQTS